MIDNKDKVHGKSFVLCGGDVQLINAVERMLFFAGAKVEASTSAQKGISLMRNLRPDIFILEGTNTDTTTDEVLNTLQNDELTKDIPIILIAEDNILEVTKTTFGETAFEYLSKTNFDVMNLIVKIEEVLRQNKKAEDDKVFDFSESDKNITTSLAAPHLRLLVVEDDLLLRNLLTMRLQKSVIPFEFCASGLDAYAKVLEYKPTIIILDLMLPGKNGLEVLSEIRSGSDTKNIPVIIFSNKDDEKERARAAELGVTAFLVKATTDLSDLVALILEKGK